MGATIWYYPYGTGLLKEVDLGEPLTEIAVREVKDQVEHEAISGRRVQITYSSRWLVRATYELLTDQDVVHELEAICNHLRAGGVIALAEQNDKTLGAFLREAPDKDEDNLNWFTQMYSQFGGTWTPTTGDVLILRGASPRNLREDVVCTSGGSSTGANLSTEVRYDWESQPWVFVHNRGFWPCLQLQRGHVNDELLHSERRIHYTLDLPLEEPPGALTSLSQAPDDPLPGDDVEDGVLTLDERVGSSSGRSTIGGMPDQSSPKDGGNPHPPTPPPSPLRWF